MPRAGSGPIRRAFRKMALTLLVIYCLLALAEGTGSFLAFGYQLVYVDRTDPRQHSYSRYDELLGWNHVPDAYVSNLFGLGGSLKINARGFRGDEDFGAAVPPGKARVICSGDSFTFGDGVGNQHTWCHLLGTLEPRLQTVNMGQSGFGVDQAYLWYARDGVKLEHDVHVFAFIENDFGRVASDNFRGYPKPLLALQDGRLAVENLPLSRLRASMPRLTEKLRHLDQLYLTQFLRRIVKTLRPPKRRGSAPSKLGPVVAEIFRDLQRLNREKGSTLVLAYLPMRSEVQAKGPHPWRNFVRAEARRQGILFVDLIPDFQRLGPELGRHFLRDGHYSPAGNRFVAERLLERLRQFPESAAKLQPGPG